MLQETPYPIGVDRVGDEARHRLRAGLRQTPEVSNHPVEVVDLVLLDVLKVLLKPLLADLRWPRLPRGLSFSREGRFLEQVPNLDA